MGDYLYNVPVEVLIERGLIDRDEGIFNPGGYIFMEDGIPHLLRESFRALGILSPILVYEDGQGRYHIVDGRKRLAFAGECGLDEVKAVLLPPTTPIFYIFAYLRNEWDAFVSESVMNAIGFLALAGKAGIRDEEKLRELSPVWGGTGFMEDVGRVMGLPLQLRRFLHEKRYSLRQIRSVILFPREVIEILTGWIGQLHLTASTLEEVGTTLRDCSIRKGVTPEEFVVSSGISELIAADMPVKEKTGALLRLLRGLRYPTLTEVNRKIEEKLSELALPDGIDIRWDRTLENREIRVSLSIKKPSDLEAMEKALGSQSLKRAIIESLDYL